MRPALNGFFWVDGAVTRVGPASAEESFSAVFRPLLVDVIKQGWWLIPASPCCQDKRVSVPYGKPWRRSVTSPGALIDCSPLRMGEHM